MNADDVNTTSRLPRQGRGLRLIIAMLAFPIVALSAHGQPAADYPSRPVKLVVPFAAGGGTDVQARAIARALEPVLNATFVVENRPGAGGGVAAKAVAESKPDGYTLLVGSTGTHGTNEFLYENLPYDPDKDFEPISLLTTFDNVVVVPANSPVRSLEELVAMIKARPGKINYGITTIGSSSHLAVELFKREAKLDMVGVPYNGASLATTDLLGGRLDFMLDLIGTQHANIKAGKVRPLATTGSRRSPVLPDVPTIAESGYPGFNAIGWIGLFAPKGTPAPILDKLHTGLVKAFESPQLKEYMTTNGVSLATLSPREYDKFLKEERAKWSALIRAANIKLN